MVNYQLAAIIPAAGSGRRMNTEKNKIWLELNGKSIIEHTLEVFLNFGRFAIIILVMKPDEITDFQSILPGYTKDGQRVVLVQGGKERQDSVGNGLKYLEEWPGWERDSEKLVVIHDAARTLLTEELLIKAINGGKEFQAATLGVPVKDTIKKVDRDGIVVETPERSSLWAVQTPQVFEFNLLVKCYQLRAGEVHRFSDDCGIVESCGYPVKIIPSSPENLKITTPEDLLTASAILKGRENENRTRV